jgi:hypothetical protein
LEITENEPDNLKLVDVLDDEERNTHEVEENGNKSY